MLRRVAIAMPRVAGVRALFSASRPTLATSPFAIFLKQNKGNAELAGLPALARAKKMGKLYRALKPSELASLKAKAATTTFKRRGPKVRKPRKANHWALFVKKHYSKVTQLPFLKRLSALAKLRAKLQ